MNRYARLISALAPDPDAAAAEGATGGLPDLRGLALLEWIERARPQVEGRPRNIRWFPYWRQYYEDEFQDKCVLAGRQVWKTTAITDEVAHAATANPSSQVVFVTDNGPHLTAFSNQKLRVGTFADNPLLAAFPRSQHTMGSVGEVSLKNHSTVYMDHTTEARGFRRVEGKSPIMACVDEFQYCFGTIEVLVESMAITQGSLRLYGIGGEMGSYWGKKWNESDQREWVFDDPSWRDKLRFDKTGFVTGPYLEKVLAGKWKPTHPENSRERHGYHLPQTHMAHIPMTIKDAIKKYKIHAKHSIEYKRKRYPPSTFETHVMGHMYRSRRRPVTDEMVRACMLPYGRLGLLSPEKVRDMKARHGENLVVSWGSDWGSNPSLSYTVFCVMLYWKKHDIYQIAHIERRSAEQQMLQAVAAVARFRQYGCEIGMADVGYGANQVAFMQRGGRHPMSGEGITGLGDTVLYGCRSVLGRDRPFMVHDSVVDEHGQTTTALRADKTALVDVAIDPVEIIKKHPASSYAKAGKRPGLIIPYAEPDKVEFLVSDYTAIKRTDIEVADDITEQVEDRREFARKRYDHPRDAVMAIAYSVAAIDYLLSRRWQWA